MAHNRIAMFPGNLLLQQFQLFIKKFNNIPCFRANHMIVVIIIQTRFVAAPSITHVHFSDQLVFYKYINGSVYGGSGHPDALRAQAQVNVFSVPVLLALSDLIPDSLALCCITQSFFVKNSR